jgi:hypothetical protein
MRVMSVSKEFGWYQDMPSAIGTSPDDVESLHSMCGTPFSQVHNYFRSIGWNISSVTLTPSTPQRLLQSKTRLAHACGVLVVDIAVVLPPVLDVVVLLL